MKQYQGLTGEEAEVSAKKYGDNTLTPKKRKTFWQTYWSKYDDGKRVSSPFYHELHIAQLTAMYDLFGDNIYKEFADKWKRYQNSFWKRTRAFIKKEMVYLKTK